MKMDNVIRARVSEDILRMFAELKEIYGIDSDSELLRRMVLHMYRKRPVMTADPIAPKRKKEDGK